MNILRSKQKIQKYTQQPIYGYGKHEHVSRCIVTYSFSIGDILLFKP